MTPPALLDAIERRYACREFVSGDAPTGEELALVVEAGRVAPSAFGLEPWRFIVVPDESRAAVAHACYDQPAAATAAALVAVVALVAALEPDSAYVRARFAAEKRGDDLTSICAAYRDHYRADTIAAWAQGQCNFAAAQMLLQATHLGLASCPLGGFDADALARALWPCRRARRLPSSSHSATARIPPPSACASRSPERKKKQGPAAPVRSVKTRFSA